MVVELDFKLVEHAPVIGLWGTGYFIGLIVSKLWWSYWACRWRGWWIMKFRFSATQHR